jgi:hypothetical protein
MFLYRKLLASRPKHAGFLRSTAVLSEKLGEPNKAMECWRTIIAGADQTTALWFEAKYNLIRMLAQSDPGRARQVLDQHKLLNPEFGPEPWGSRLKGLDQSIPQSGIAPQTMPSDQSSGGDQG